MHPVVLEARRISYPLDLCWCFTTLYLSLTMDPSPSLDNQLPGLSAEDYKIQVNLPALPESFPHAWNQVNEKQLRSALIGACKRMPRNAEAHFHLGLMYMRKCEGEEALAAFRHCKQLLQERLEHHRSSSTAPPPPHLLIKLARLGSHTTQAAYLAAVNSIAREERAPFLERMQNDLIAATNLDKNQPDIWNALALLHLTEGGSHGARDVLHCARNSFPDYLDALNNLGLSELAVGEEESAISCFQKVILCDRHHNEALSNYALVLLRHGMYEAAIRAYEGAIDLSTPDAPGIAYAWGGLAVARAALQQFEAAELAARHAEQVADPPNRARFAMLHTSMHARRIQAQLRRRPPPHSNDPSTSQDANGQELDMESRTAIDAAILRLRALARDIRSSASSTALGTVLRIRHEHLWEESGNRNFGAEAAERLVEALEQDQNDASAWVQLALLQMGTGEYSSAREFSMQAVSRNCNIESAWNSMAVATALQLDDGQEAKKAIEKAMQVTRINYCKNKEKVKQKRGRSTGPRRNGEESGGNIEEDCAEDRPLITPSSPSKMGLRKLFLSEADGFSDEDDLTEVGQNTMAALYNNIGNIFRQSGVKHFQNALQCFERSLKLGGENAVVYNNLALLYISVSKYDSADKMLEHARKLEPHLACAMSNQLKLRALRRRKEQSKSSRDENELVDTVGTIGTGAEITGGGEDDGDEFLSQGEEEAENEGEDEMVDEECEEDETDESDEQGGRGDEGIELGENGGDDFFDENSGNRNGDGEENDGDSGDGEDEYVSVGTM